MRAHATYATRHGEAGLVWELAKAQGSGRIRNKTSCPVSLAIKIKYKIIYSHTMHNSLIIIH